MVRTIFVIKMGISDVYPVGLTKKTIVELRFAKLMAKLAKMETVQHLGVANVKLDGKFPYPKLKYCRDTFHY